MNKPKLYNLLIMLTVLLALASCGGHHSAASKLAAADSLLHADADSALSLLEQIDASSLPSSQERAYHSLLLTQARYWCYIPATSDSAINTALQYYQQHGKDREKLTRAYIYMGAVTEELGQEEDALHYYKRAESIASTGDHFNHGYIKLRIGNMYRDNLVVDSSDIKLFKEALKEFKQVPDSFYILTTINAIGSSFIRYDRDSAKVYLLAARRLAQRMNNVGSELENSRYLADMYLFGNQAQEVEMAKGIALSFIDRNRCPNVDRQHFLMVAALALAKQNKADSAILFMNQVEKPLLNSGLKVFYYKCHAELARCRGDINQFQHYYEQSNHLSDSLANNNMQQQLRDVEARYNNENHKYKALKYKSNWVISILGALLVVVLLGAALLTFMRTSAHRKRLLQEQEDMIDQLQEDTLTLKSRLAEHQTMSDSLKATISNQIGVFTQLVMQFKAQYPNQPKKFSDAFIKSYDVHQLDSSFWSGLRNYADSVCHNIITHTEQNWPQVLREQDLRFLSLCCCNLPPSVIMTCMGYKEIHSFYNKKRRLAEIMGLPGKLDDYIAQFMPS